jgi:hypothetical protein
LPAPPPSTALSSTGTATCSERSTPRRPARHRRQRRAGRQPGIPASRPARRPRTRPPAPRPHPAARKRLSETLGEQAWRESGLGAPAGIDALSHTITCLEQQAADLRIQLEERDSELAAARAANRELMTQLNAAHHQ